jgi:hypothetical protein
VTYAVTIAPGLKDVVLPNGSRYQAGDVVVLSDAEFAQLSPTSGPLFSDTQTLGTVDYRATIAAGKTNVVLPTGLRYQPGDWVALSDAEYSTMPSPAVIGDLFSLFEAEVA